MDQTDTRGMTVHFMDGTRMRFTGPKQAKDDWDAIRKMQLVLDRPYLCLETEDSAMIIPMATDCFHGMPSIRQMPVTRAPVIAT